MKSEITPGNEGISALTNPNRPMVGQSEYVVNAGLGWSSRRLGRQRCSTTWPGQRIAEAGTGGLPDAYEQPRHLLDASLQVPVLQTHRRSSSTRKNLLDSPYRLTQGDVVRHEYHSGRVFAFGFTWQP